jgi:hypothetical protein
MKIIDTDNFGGDYPDEKVIAENIKEPFASVALEAINEKFSGNHAPRHYLLVEDDYELAPGFEP